MRKALKYPPFCDIIMFGISGINLEEVTNISKMLYQKLKNVNLNDGILLKPMPAPVDKIKNRYRWRIIIKSNINNEIIKKINEILEDFYKMNYKDSRVIVDVNPNNLL